MTNDLTISSANLQSQRDCVLQSRNGGIASSELRRVYGLLRNSTLKGLWTFGLGRQFGGVAFLSRLNSTHSAYPRIARCSQPWALCRNAFGILQRFGFPPSFFIRPSSFTPVMFLALGLISSGCRRDMFNQPSSKTLSESDFFQDNHMASRPIVAHTIARGELNEDEAFYTGKLGTNLVTEFPLPITREVLLRGRERFEIYCSACHDRTGEGRGIVVQRGFPPPPSLHVDRLRFAPVGHFFDVISHGYGIMYSYADRVEPADRWAIAAYIRVLQASQSATVADVPAAERPRLEAAK
jgi:cbb3-type cytochrome c oxidase subunit III